ncbi:hypothetical protein FIU95_17915 [Microbulbifer sp. THAF38]|nr:hypothetical protein FIU95_17915 [Microbulbifer sp. THAF38]
MIHKSPLGKNAGAGMILVSGSVKPCLEEGYLGRLLKRGDTPAQLIETQGVVF